MAILYFEPGVSGHRADYLSTLLRHGGEDWLVAAPEALIERLPAAARAHLSSKGGPILHHPLEAMHSFDGAAIWKSSIALARETGCSSIFHPYLDPVILASPRLSVARDIETAGIFFRPIVRHQAVSGLKGRAIALSKSLIFKRFLARRDVASVLTFDRYFAADFAEGRGERAKVRFLPDMMPFPESLVDAVGGGETRHADGRTRFILFGALQRRKGVYETLDALERLDPDRAARTEVRFCGQVFEDAGELPARLKAINARTPAKVSLENRFLPQEQLAAEIARSDVVLAPYQQHRGSSGVLYWAAAFGKPIITQSFGLIGREAREFRLGATVDTADPDALAAAMAQPPARDADLARVYIEGHGEADFARGIDEAL